MSLIAVLGPVFVQVALTFALLIWSGTLRIRAVRTGVVHSRDIALRQPNWPPRATQISNAFQNQLELPVLFYVVVVLALFTARATLLLVVLAWAVRPLPAAPRADPRHHQQRRAPVLRLLCRLGRADRRCGSVFLYESSAGP